MPVLRPMSAILLLFGLIAASALNAEADSSAPDPCMMPGWKALASTNWDIKAAGIKNWREMLTHWADGQDCEDQRCSSAGWPAMVAKVKAAGDVVAQVKAANSLINNHPYKEDIKNWGIAEYWETPYEFLKKSGDTEDFAIAKYFLLKAAGVPVDDMQIIMVRAKSLGGISHAVLAVRPDSARTFILDNRIMAVLDATLLNDEFKPALGVNESHWCVYPAQQ